MFTFIVLTVEFVSWWVFEVFLTSYGWKEGSGEEEGAGKDPRRKMERREGTEDRRKEQIVWWDPSSPNRPVGDPQGEEGKDENKCFLRWGPQAHGWEVGVSQPPAHRPQALLPWSRDGEPWGTLLSHKLELLVDPENGNCLPSSHSAGQVGLWKPLIFCKFLDIKTDKVPVLRDSQVGKTDKWTHQDKITNQHKCYREEKRIFVFRFTVSDVAKVGPQQGQKPTRLTWDLALAPLLGSLSWDVRAKALPSWHYWLGASQGDRWIPPMQCAWPEEHWGLRHVMWTNK